MAIRDILQYPDKRLRNRAEPIAAVTPEVARLIEDMKETMYAAPGCGLAAPQIGVSLRLFIVDTASEDEPSDLRVFINPEIVSREGKVVWEEGCLSFPGVHEDIERAAKVVVRAINERGEPVVLEAEGLLGVAVQHENDHLDGVLMIDHMGVLKRRMALRKLQKRAASAEL
ncbi:MAG TPA: peptide deformylase [Polyangiaceae bacterium]|jgi:peptide deformylase|nr:peptide deformylase [Polyangiaceae bacterium]